VPTGDDLPTDTIINGMDYAWTFDDIGNRKTATVNSQISNYTANLLNQYDSRTVPGGFDIMGEAQPDAKVTVTVGSGLPQPVTRQDGLFFKQVIVDNSTAAVANPVRITGVKNNIGPNGEDAVTEIDRFNFTSKTPETYSHDADGNLTGDARWAYTWDGENRQIAMETTASAVTAGTPKQKLEFAYDGQSRRIAKKVYGWDTTSGSWILDSSLLFLYDGWNLIAELSVVGGQSSVVRSYVWGLDLSGSIQGAGGVGGLLFASAQTQDPITQTPTLAVHAPAFDGNGNVIGLTNMNDGSRSAEFEYGAFGETLKADGPAADVLPFRFSTHYFDQETGLLYAKNRFIKDGRFLNRDPIEEQGGLNIYGFVGNDPISRVDPYGLQFSGNYPGYAPYGFGPIGPINTSGYPTRPPGPMDYVPGWARVSGNYSISLSTLFGQGGTAAVYFPFPAAPAFGVYAKFDGTMKTGTCCKDGVKKSYSSLTGTVTLGVYAGNPGTEFRITAPFVENLSLCPEPLVLKLRGIAQGAVRLGPASFTVSINGDGNVSFSGSYQVPVNLFTARASIGGGIQGSWVQINN